LLINHILSFTCNKFTGYELVMDYDTIFSGLKLEPRDWCWDSEDGRDEATVPDDI